MKRTITAILAIALMAVPANAIAHIETWADGYFMKNITLKAK